jgi:glycosyltransferase involved in cell wall biosynthesis
LERTQARPSAADAPPAPAQLHPVVHVVEHMAPGGIETLARDLIHASDGHGRIISLQGATDTLIADWPALEPVANVIEGLETGGGLRPAMVRRLARRLRALRARAVVLHHIGPLLYGGLAARMAGVPRVIHVEHDVWHYQAHPRHRRLTQWAERLVRPAHVALSQGAAAVLREMLPRACIEVIPTGIDLGRFTPDGRASARAALGLSQDDHAIGTAGRLVPVKAHHDLLAAFARLTRRARLFIIGDGPQMPPLREQAHDLGLGERAAFLGHRDDVADLMPGLDVFALASHAEGLPRSLLEAQACGVPVAATRVGSVAEAVCPESGHLVPPGDPDAMADALAAALSCPPATSPRRFVEQAYDWQRTLAAYGWLTGESHAG